MAQTIKSLTVVNADTGANIMQLANGAVLNLAALPTRRLAFRADTDPARVGSVIFTFSGSAVRTENVAPYYMHGDTNGKPNAWTPPVGQKTMTAVPCSAANGGGTKGTQFSATFTVKDEAVTQPPPPSPPPPTTDPRDAEIASLKAQLAAATDKVARAIAALG